MAISGSKFIMENSKHVILLVMPSHGVSNGKTCKEMREKTVEILGLFLGDLGFW